MTQPGEHLTHQLLLDNLNQQLEPLRRPMTRPIMHSHLTEQVSMRPSLEQRPEMCWPVMASRCARCGDRAHPPRDILAAHEAKHLDHLWSPVRATGSSSSSSCQRGYQPSPSRSGWPGGEQRGWPAPTRHTRSTVTEGLRRARARLRQPAHRPWSPSGRRWGPGIPQVPDLVLGALGSR